MSVKNKVVAILTDYAKRRNYELPEGGLDLDKALEDYGLESLDEVAVLAEIEQELGVRIEDDDALDIRSLNDLIRVVEKSKPK